MLAAMYVARTLTENRLMVCVTPAGEYMRKAFADNAKNESGGEVSFPPSVAPRTFHWWTWYSVSVPDAAGTLRVTADATAANRTATTITSRPFVQAFTVFAYS